jgi:cbb3-type cytochrome oxidase subunit 3
MANPVAAIAGVGIPAAIVFVFGFIGVIWSALWRERTIGRVAHAARRLKPDQRDKVFAEIADMLGANAAAKKGSGEVQGLSADA